MSLVAEYRRQFAWRDWKTALDLCPISPGQRVLDLGCGPGDLSRELAARGAMVTGVDANEELLETARRTCPGARFVSQNLNELELEPAGYDGLWCSFAAAYFPDLETALRKWAAFLKPRSWVCLIEIDDLFGHEPLSLESRRMIERFYQEAAAEGRYDFKMGRKIGPALQRLGFETTSIQLRDLELSFEGAARPDVLEAWSARLDRMTTLRRFFGDRYSGFREEFLAALIRTDHRSLCKVSCCIGTLSS